MKELLIHRPIYLDKLKKWLNHHELVKIITGVRRCGKSKLLHLFQNFLLEEKKAVPEQIISINLEDMLQTNKIGLSYNKNRLLEPAGALLDFVMKKLNPHQMNYVFIDEIQLVTDWQQVANTLRLRGYVDLYLTGSNAHMFSADLSNYFGGRYVEIKMLPYSFKEYVTAESVLPETLFSLDARKSDYMSVYERYVTQSGFPQTLYFWDREQIVDYLMNTVYFNTFQKDIVQRFKVSDDNKLDAVIKYVFDNIGNETSLRGIEKSLKAAGQSISAPTVDTYLKGLTDSYLIYKCDRYDIKGKQFLNAHAKYYVCDVGLRNILLGKSDMDLGHILENVVYLELLRRGYQVSVGRISKVEKEDGISQRKNIEIDFVAQKAGKKAYYQVAYYALDPDVLKRELAPLELINDNYPKFLLSMDPGSGDNNGIMRRNVLEWLLEE